MSKLSKQTVSPGYSVLFLPFRNHRKMIAVMANLKHPLGLSEGSSDCHLKGEGPPWVWMARPNGLGCGPRKGKEPVEWWHSHVCAYWLIRMWTSSLDFSPRGCPQPSIWPWNLAMESVSPQTESKSVPFSLLAFVKYLVMSKVIETGLFLFTAVMSSPPWQMML